MPRLLCVLNRTRVTPDPTCAASTGVYLCSSAPHTASTHTASTHTASTHTASTHTASTRTAYTHTASTHTASTHTASTHTASLQKRRRWVPTLAHRP
jgi:hypothetical protein